jgi:hypothetical protein
MIDRRAVAGSAAPRATTISVLQAWRLGFD